LDAKELSALMDSSHYHGDAPLRARSLAASIRADLQTTIAE